MEICTSGDCYFNLHSKRRQKIPSVTKMLHFSWFNKAEQWGKMLIFFLLQYLYFWRLVDLCAGEICQWYFGLETQSWKTWKLSEKQEPADRVKRAPFMLHPPRHTQMPGVHLGKSCPKQQRQEQPLIRAVTVIVLTAEPKLMKTDLEIHPWNVYGKVSIPSVLLVISLWKNIAEVNVKLTLFFFHLMYLLS